MAKEKTREEIFSEIKEFVDRNDGICQLKRPLKIKVNGRHVDLTALIDKVSYLCYDNPVTNLVGMVQSWSKVETYDIDDYCDTDKLRQLLDILNGVEEKTRDGFLLFKFEDGVMCPPEMFSDTLALAGRMKELADALAVKCREAGVEVEHDYNQFYSEKLGYHYRRYQFSVPASAEKLYVSCVVDNNSETDKGFSSCRMTHDEGNARRGYVDMTTVFMENYQDAVEDGDMTTSLVCTHGMDGMYVAGYYTTKEDKSVESHVAMFMEIDLTK